MVPEHGGQVLPGVVDEAFQDFVGGLFLSKGVVGFWGDVKEKHGMAGRVLFGPFLDVVDADEGITCLHGFSCNFGILLACVYVGVYINQ
jgi:hypothetical protein